MMFAAKGASAPKTDVYRYVDCAAVRPEAIVTITASRGKLATLLTRDPVITVSTRGIRLCN
jgi:sortase (surface protein transpeptidase)